MDEHVYLFSYKVENQLYENKKKRSIAVKYKLF